MITDMIQSLLGMGADAQDKQATFTYGAHTYTMKGTLNAEAYDAKAKGVVTFTNIPANMYNGGHAIDDIWSVCGFKSRSSIFRVLKKYGITLNRGHHSGTIKKWSERKNPIIRNGKNDKEVSE